MEEDNLPKTEIKVDLTQTVENVYDDTFKKPAKSSSEIVTTVLDFFHNTVLYPMQKYNLYAKDKLQKFANEIETRATEIPDKNLVAPKVNILGPVIEGLKYNLDEDYIKNYFTNILISDMDNRKQDKVLPSYIEIVKQLSKNDAETLQFFKENNIIEQPIIKLKYIFDTGGFIDASTSIGLIYNEKDIPLDAIILDNLCRLKLIEINFDEQRNDETIYSKSFERIKLCNEFKVLPNKVKELGYSKGLLKITQFGRSFIDICLS